MTCGSCLSLSACVHVGVMQKFLEHFLACTLPGRVSVPYCMEHPSVIVTNWSMSDMFYDRWNWQPELAIQVEALCSLSDQHAAAVGGGQGAGWWAAEPHAGCTDPSR